MKSVYNEINDFLNRLVEERKENREDINEALKLICEEEKIFI